MIFCAITFFAPNIWLSGRSRSASKRSGALPDAMDLMVTCVEAGLALDAAMSRVGRSWSWWRPILAQS